MGNKNTKQKDASVSPHRLKKKKSLPARGFRKAQKMLEKRRNKNKGKSPEGKEEEKFEPQLLPMDSYRDPFGGTLDKFRAEEKMLIDLEANTNFDMVTIRKLHLAFSEVAGLDVDDDVIDRAELTKSMGIHDPNSVLAGTFFRLFDNSTSLEINFKNWVQTLSALSKEATPNEKIKFSFRMYDANGDGLIDLAELSTLLKAAVRENENFLDLDAEQIDEICQQTFSQADSDNNGIIDYIEYRRMVTTSDTFMAAFTLNVEDMMEGFHFGTHISQSPMDEQAARDKARRFKLPEPAKEQSDGHSCKIGEIPQIEAVSVVEDMDDLFGDT